MLEWGCFVHMRFGVLAAAGRIAVEVPIPPSVQAADSHLDDLVHTLEVYQACLNSEGPEYHSCGKVRHHRPPSLRAQAKLMIGSCCLASDLGSVR